MLKMVDNIEEKIRETIKEVMGLDIKSFNESRKFNTISEWDSFNNLMLISKFQDIFKVEFTAVEIEETKTIRDLFELIKNKTK